jgi:hypothetical protein
MAAYYTTCQCQVLPSWVASLPYPQTLDWAGEACHWPFRKLLIKKLHNIGPTAEIAAVNVKLKSLIINLLNVN